MARRRGQEVVKIVVLGELAGPERSLRRARRDSQERPRDDGEEEGLVQLLRWRGCRGEDTQAHILEAVMILPAGDDHRLILWIRVIGDPSEIWRVAN